MDEYWYWICIKARLGFSLLFNVGFIASLTYLDSLSDSKYIILDEDDKKSKKQSSFKAQK